MKFGSNLFKMRPRPMLGRICLSRLFMIVKMCRNGVGSAIQSKLLSSSAQAHTKGRKRLFFCPSLGSSRSSIALLKPAISLTATGGDPSTAISKESRSLIRTSLLCSTVLVAIFMNCGEINTNRWIHGKSRCKQGGFGMGGHCFVFGAST